MNKKIRVLECIRQGQIGGGESHLLSLVENLDKSRFDPLVLSFTDGPMVNRLQEMGVATRVLYTETPFDIRKWRQVRAFIRGTGADLIHAHGTRACSNVLWAARSLGIPVIYTVHGWSFHQDQKPWVQRVRIMGERYLTSRSDLNISVSASNRDSGKKVLPTFTSVVINNGIDLNKFDPVRQYPDVREEMGIPKDRLLVLFLARFTAHKQPLSLIRAFAAAWQSQPNLHLLLVGDGDQKEEAIRLISELNLQERVTLQPFRQDVPAVLAAADLYVLPSLWEGLPIGLLEAMVMGKAVLATEVDGTCEVVQSEVNGLLVRTEELVPNLTQALLRLSNEAELRARLGRAARTMTREEFDAASMTRRIEWLYEQLAAGVAGETVRAEAAATAV